jgi:prepilin-type N-terminal cleavage/methylation domain-containing protein
MSATAPTTRIDGRRDAAQAGFTLVEVLVALLIVATTIATLQTVSNATLRLAVETNRLRIAKMLLRAKAEEVCSGVEQGTGGTFDGFPGYEWSVAATEVPIDTSGGTGSSTGSSTGPSTGGGGSGAQPESVIAVTISVSMPSFSGSTDPSLTEANGDPPGIVAVRTYPPPPDAKLQPPGGTGGIGGTVKTGP